MGILTTKNTKDTKKRPKISFSRLSRLKIKVERGKITTKNTKNTKKRPKISFSRVFAVKN
jgi:hypothetical protein